MKPPNEGSGAKPAGMPGSLRVLSVPALIAASSIVRETVRAAAFECTLVGRPGVDALQVREQLRPARVEPGALRGGLDRKAHLHVGDAELVAGEPFALAELAFHEVELALQ